MNPRHQEPRKLAMRRQQRAKPTADSSIERLLKVLQIIAILATGAWTLSLFLSHQRQQELLRTEQMRLDIERSKATANIIELEKNIKTAELRDIIQGRIATKYEFNVECSDKPGMYNANFSYRFENISKSQIEISWTLLHRFIGSPASPLESDGVIMLTALPFRISI